MEEEEPTADPLPPVPLQAPPTSAPSSTVGARRGLLSRSQPPPLETMEGEELATDSSLSAPLQPPPTSAAASTAGARPVPGAANPQPLVELGPPLDPEHPRLVESLPLSPWLVEWASPPRPVVLEMTPSTPMLVGVPPMVVGPPPSTTPPPPPPSSPARDVVFGTQVWVFELGMKFLCFELGIHVQV
jgi:hypothetical protein